MFQVFRQLQRMPRTRLAARDILATPALDYLILQVSEPFKIFFIHFVLRHTLMLII